MKDFYAAIRLICLASLFAAPASANPILQSKEPEPTRLPLSTTPDFKKDFKVVPQVGARFSSQGAGTQSFVGVEGFVPLFQSPGQHLTYVEGRLQVSTENGRLGSNALLGHRFLSSSGQSIVGGYVSYDTRNTGDATFNQLGLGFEHLSNAFDFRTNFYLPIGNRSRRLSSTLIGSPQFQGNVFGVNSLNLIQEALTGVDVEVGTKLANLGRGTLRGYVGAYHYEGDGNRFTGFRTRLVARPTDSITAGLTFQSDARFDTRLMFNIGFAFPGSSSGQTPEPSILARLGESPERQQSILVDQFLKSKFELAINPKTGKPWNFQFVTLETGTGDGTFEAPSGTVAAVLPKVNADKADNIVYVRAGSRNLGIPGFTIPDGVTVLSTAVPVSRATIPTQFGNLTLPDAGTGFQPKVTGPIVLGNNTVLGGFNVVNSPSFGIRGQDIQNVAIFNNQTIDSLRTGISLRNVTGRVEISDNIVDGTGSNTPGILLVNTAGSVNALIQNNEVYDSDSSGIVFQIEGTAQGVATIANNTLIDNLGGGIFTAAYDSGKLNSRITSNVVDNIEDGGPLGITAYADNSAQNTTVIDSNEVSSAGIATSARGQGRVDATITNNTVTNGPSIAISGITYRGFDNSTGNVNISGNTVSGFNTPPSSDPLDSANGILVAVFDKSQATATITKNTATNNLRGINVGANNQARLQATIAENTVQGNLLEGISVTGSASPSSIVDGTPQVAAIVQSNTVTGNNLTNQGFGDVAVATFSPGAKVCFQLSSNTIGVLAIADKTPSGDFPPLDPPLSFLAGQVAVELPYSPLDNRNGNNNNVTTINPSTFVLWSNTKIPAGSCRLP
jgi:trimeric autotransporter adhesin